MITNVVSNLRIIKQQKGNCKKTTLSVLLYNPFYKCNFTSGPSVPQQSQSALEKAAEIAQQLQPPNVS